MKWFAVVLLLLCLLVTAGYFLRASAMDELRAEMRQQMRVHDERDYERRLMDQQIKRWESINRY